MSSISSINPIRFRNLQAVARLLCANMRPTNDAGEFTEPAYIGWLNCMMLPLALAVQQHGFHLADGNRAVACGYLHYRSTSAYIFNVVVAEAYRRRGLARRLMHGLEEEVVARRVPWQALFVDRPNEGARALYSSLGFRPYNHQTWLRKRAEPLGGIHRSEVRQVAMMPTWGRHRFRELSRIERDEGDGWAADVVTADYEPLLPHGGQYWRLMWGKEMVGMAWTGNRRYQKPKRVVVSLRLYPEYWGDGNLLLTLLRELVGETGRFPQEISLHLGSQAHYLSSIPTMENAGFSQHVRPRILMLKQNEWAPHDRDTIPKTP